MRWRPVCTAPLLPFNHRGCTSELARGRQPATLQAGAWARLPAALGGRLACPPAQNARAQPAAWPARRPPTMGPPAPRPLRPLAVPRHWIGGQGQCHWPAHRPARAQRLCRRRPGAALRPRSAPLPARRQLCPPPADPARAPPPLPAGSSGSICSRQSSQGSSSSRASASSLPSQPSSNSRRHGAARGGGAPGPGPFHRHG